MTSIKPDAKFYFRVPNDIAIKRISVGRRKLKYYEAGMDLDLMTLTIAIGFFKAK